MTPTGKLSSQSSHPGLSSKSLSGKVGSTHCVFSGEDTHTWVGDPVKMGLFCPNLGVKLYDKDLGNSCWRALDGGGGLGSSAV